MNDGTRLSHMNRYNNIKVPTILLLRRNVYFFAHLAVLIDFIFDLF